MLVKRASVCFRLFHVSNLSVRNFRIFLVMYPGSVFEERSQKLTTWASVEVARHRTPPPPPPRSTLETHPSEDAQLCRIRALFRPFAEESVRRAVLLLIGGPRWLVVGGPSPQGRRHGFLGGGTNRLQCGHLPPKFPRKSEMTPDSFSNLVGTYPRISKVVRVSTSPLPPVATSLLVLELLLTAGVRLGVVGGGRAAMSQVPRIFGLFYLHFTSMISILREIYFSNLVLNPFRPCADLSLNLHLF